MCLYPAEMDTVATSVIVVVEVVSSQVAVFTPVPTVIVTMGVIVMVTTALQSPVTVVRLSKQDLVIYYRTS